MTLEERAIRAQAFRDAAAIVLHEGLSGVKVEQGSPEYHRQQAAERFALVLASQAKWVESGAEKMMAAQVETWSSCNSEPGPVTRLMMLARIASLEEACMPFARMLTHVLSVDAVLTDDTPLVPFPSLTGGNANLATVGDLRRLAERLGGKSNG